MKKITQLLILSIIYITTITPLNKAIREHKSHDLSLLINNFKNYKTTNERFHAGDLYEHSVWVATTINEWSNKKNEWTQGLSPHDQKLATLAGLLHDVGKAGDLVFTYYTKRQHPQIGRDYILGKRQFLLNKNTTFNFDKMFKRINFSDTDKKIVSILVAAHHDFGTLIKTTKHIQLTTTHHTTLKPYLQTYKKKLQQYARQAGYKQPIDQKIIKLAVLVSAADVHGAQPCSCGTPFDIANLTIHKSPSAVHKKATEKFKNFEYHTRGKYLQKLLIH